MAFFQIRYMGEKRVRSVGYHLTDFLVRVWSKKAKPGDLPRGVFAFRPSEFRWFPTWPHEYSESWLPGDLVLVTCHPFEAMPFPTTRWAYRYRSSSRHLVPIREPDWMSGYDWVYPPDEYVLNPFSERLEFKVNR